MNWKEISVEVNEESYEAVANILNELGSNGVVFEETGSRVKLTAYYNNDENFPALLERLRERINELSAYALDAGDAVITVQDRKDEDWSTNWHKFFRPLEIGENFIIAPSWENIDEDKRKIIRIDPGMAFGIGSHETTRLCIELMEKHIGGNLQGKRMLDIGTGTGILAIVAAQLGIEDIVAVDIDPVAVEAARENIRINQVADKVQVLQGDMTEKVTGKFSIITANLIHDLIIKLLPSLPPFLEEGAISILSGIIMKKRDLVLEKIHEMDFEVIDEMVLNDWVAFVVKRK
ncbi:MAG: 50S ribosomal protein L11 methyltransferase [Halanaerobiales bacterium]